MNHKLNLYLKVLLLFFIRKIRLETGNKTVSEIIHIKNNLRNIVFEDKEIFNSVVVIFGYYIRTNDDINLFLDTKSEIKNIYEKNRTFNNFIKTLSVSFLSYLLKAKESGADQMKINNIILLGYKNILNAFFEIDKIIKLSKEINKNIFNAELASILKFHNLKKINRDVRIYELNAEKNVGLVEYCYLFMYCQIKKKFTIFDCVL